MYAHFQDLVDAYVGPFATNADVLAHVQFCADRGDCAAYLGTVDALPADAFVMSPQEDKEFTE